MPPFLRGIIFYQLQEQEMKSDLLILKVLTAKSSSDVLNSYIDSLLLTEEGDTTLHPIVHKELANIIAYGHCMKEVEDAEAYGDLAVRLSTKYMGMYILFKMTKYTKLSGYRTVIKECFSLLERKDSEKIRGYLVHSLKNVGPITKSVF